MSAQQRHAYTAVTITAVLAACAAVVALPRLGDRTGPYGVPRGVVTTWVSGNDLLGVSLSFFVDQLSAILLLLAAVVGLLVQIYSTAYLEGDPRYRAYTLIIQLFLVGMACVVVADNLWMLLVGWEVMGLCSYLLISHHWELGPARAGAVKAFLLTRVGDLALMVAIFAVGATFGTYRISEVLAAMASSDAPQHLSGIGMLLGLAALAKSAQVPFQSWLADAMPGPTPISALIHAATMVAAGVFLLARLYPVVTASAVVPTLLALVACVTMLLGALMALAGKDLKRILAWSTVSQLAYMFAALAVGGYDAAVQHLLAHGAFKALLFLVAGAVALRTGSTALNDLGCLARSMPLTAVAGAIGFAALAGLVPTVGFASKDAVLDAALHAISHDAPVAPWVAVVVLLVGLITAAITVLYALRTWWATFVAPLGEPVAGLAPRRPGAADPPPAMGFALVVLGVATFALTVVVPWHLVAGLVSTVLVVGVGVWAWSRLRAGHDVADVLGRGALADELGPDRPYALASVGAARAGDLVVATDREVIGFYPRAVAALVRGASFLLERAQSGASQRYVTVLAVGLLVLTAVVVGR